MFVDYESVEIQPKKNKIDKFSYRTVSNFTQEELADRAETLKSVSVDNKKYFGYKSDENVFVKYNKDTGETVVYTADGDIISHSIKSWGEYTGDRAIEYFDEI